MAKGEQLLSQPGRALTNKFIANRRIDSSKYGWYEGRERLMGFKVQIVRAKYQVARLLIFIGMGGISTICFLEPSYLCSLAKQWIILEGPWWSLNRKPVPIDVSGRATLGSFGGDVQLKIARTRSRIVTNPTYDRRSTIASCGNENIYSQTLQALSLS